MEAEAHAQEASVSTAEDAVEEATVAAPVAATTAGARPRTPAARRLAPLLEGLRFPSESEYPLELVELTADQLGPPENEKRSGPIPEAAVRAAAGGIPEGAPPAAERAFEALWPPLVGEQEWVDASQRAGFEAVRVQMLADLTDLVVLRFDRVEVHVFALGRCLDDDGRPAVVGFRTVSVET